MKHLLVSATIALTACIALPAMAQDSSATAPAVTMQPIPNPPEAPKPMGMGHHGKHHAKHHAMHHAKHHAKKAAAKASETTPATPPASK